MSLFESLIPEITEGMIDNLIKTPEAAEWKELQKAQLLYDNALPPEYPASMNPESRSYRLRAWTPVAICGMIVDKIASTLYSRPVNRTTGDEGLDIAMASSWETMSRLMLRTAKIASIAGNAVIRLRPVYPNSIGYATLGVGDAYPILDPDDPHGAIIGIVYDYLDESVLSQMSRGAGGASRIVHVKEILTRHIRDKDGAITFPGIHARFENGLRVGEGGYNPLGDYLDCVFWRGLEHPVDGRGRSDILPLLDTLQAMNESLTDAHELIQWNLWPIIWTDAIDAEIPYSPRTIVNIGDNARGDSAKLERLEWSGNQSGAWREVFDRLATLMHETARVPAISTGDLSAVSALSSGRAYEIAMTPLMEANREREAMAVEQEKDLIETTVAMSAYYGYVDGLTVKNDYAEVQSPDKVAIRERLTNCAVEFAPVKLAKDQMAEAQIRSVLRGAGIESTEVAIRSLHPEWSDDQVIKELERVGADEPEAVDASAEVRIKQAQEKLKQIAE